MCQWKQFIFLPKNHQITGIICWKGSPYPLYIPPFNFHIWRGRRRFIIIYFWHTNTHTHTTLTILFTFVSFSFINYQLPLENFPQKLIFHFVPSSYLERLFVWIIIIYSINYNLNRFDFSKKSYIRQFLRVHEQTHTYQEVFA